MSLPFFSCSRSALLYSISIIGAFFLFGQIGITYAATPIPPNPTYPPNTWTNTIPSGSITFQWSYTGDTTNIWFYFFMYKWDFQQGKWVVVASEYAKTNTYDTQFLADGYYAWRVAAVDIIQQDPSNWYKWNTDWVKLQLKTNTIPTAVPTNTLTPTPTPSGSTPTPTPTPTGPTPTPCASCPTYYISPIGSDTNSGTSFSAPFKTFSKAIPLLKPGYTLILEDGTYTKITTGLPNINCSTSGGNAKSGTDNSHRITIKAQNERKAHLQADGSVAAFHIVSCSYWNVEGLYGSSQDRAPVDGGGGYSVFEFAYVDHVNAKRLLAYHPNRYYNAMAIVFNYGHHNLLEESEAYFYHRFGIEMFTEISTVFRRNYANSRNSHDICFPNYTDNTCKDAQGLSCPWNGKIGWGCSIDPARGDNDIGTYANNSNPIFENNIGEGGSTNYGVSGSLNDGMTGYWLGNIAMSNLMGFQGGLNTTYGGGYNLDFENNLALNANTGVRLVGGFNFLLKNNTTIGSPTGNGIEIDASATGGTYPPAGQSATLTNNLSLNNHGNGISVAIASDFLPCDGKTTIQYNDTYNNGGTISNPNSCTASSNITTQPTGIGVGTNQCIVYIPVSSSMHRAGQSGADIEANIIYKYETDNNGSPYLSTTKLWDQSTGRFPCGATVTGVNDDATFPNSACVNVHKRLNVGVNGCPIP